ncbi:MAG: hypothetical protein B5M51_06300, partial [Anaerolinea sp. 4484_236]
MDVAKLRLWLSLVVDENDYADIKPLPNLDYKIVAGNSLLGVEKDIFNHHLFAELEELKPLYFEATKSAKKKELKDKIDALIAQLTGNKAVFDFEIYFSEVFHKKGGFDVVIGNPPYIQLQRNGGALADLYQNSGYKTFARMGDIYMLFYEKGHQVLSGNGNLCFITSNKWMRAGYGKKLRKYFLTETSPKLLIDFGDAPLFENATTYTNILLFGKKPQDTASLVADLSTKPDLMGKLSAYLNAPKKNYVPEFGEKRYLIVDKTEAAIKQKIEERGIPLMDWDIKIYRGIITGYNKAFIIDGVKRTELITEDPKSAEIIKPVLRGKDIKRYTIEKRD